MPAGYSQKSAALRAERQAVAGYTYVGTDSEVYVEVNGVLRRREPLGPSLPATVPGGGPWHPDARDWYLRFRLSPQAELLKTDPEWDSLMQAAGMLSLFCDTGEPRYYDRFLKIMEKFGAAPLDMRRLRAAVRVSGDEAEDDANAADDFESEYAETFAQIVGSM